MDDVVVAHIRAVQAGADEIAMTAEAGNSSHELAAAKEQVGRIDAEYLQAKEECLAIHKETQKMLLEQQRSVEEFKEIV